MALRPLGFEVINLGGHETITINDLVARMSKMIGQPARIEYRPAHAADLQANWANVEKAGRLLGWEPAVTLQDGLPRLVDWYRAQRDWASLVETSD